MTLGFAPETIETWPIERLASATAAAMKLS